MTENDRFENRLTTSLEERTKDIYFSAEARENVRKRIQLETDSSSKGFTEKIQQPVLSIGWWNRPIALSLPVLSMCLVLLFITAFFYVQSLFYVSPQEIAQIEGRQTITVRDGQVPFGAVQYQMAASPIKAKGVGRP